MQSMQLHTIMFFSTFVPATLKKQGLEKTHSKGTNPDFFKSKSTMLVFTNSPKKEPACAETSKDIECETLGRGVMSE